MFRAKVLNEKFGTSDWSDKSGAKAFRQRVENTKMGAIQICQY